MSYYTQLAKKAADKLAIAKMYATLYEEAQYPAQRSQYMELYNTYANEYASLKHELDLFETEYLNYNTTEETLSKIGTAYEVRDNQIFIINPKNQ